MKELSIEQKAKAYDKALERAKEFYILCKKCGAKDTIDFLEDTFPELAESEGDRIRKEILEVAETVVSCDGTLYGKKYNCREWIAWLEKQGEPELSEDFGEYIAELSKQFPEVSFAKLSRIAVRVKKWLEKQDKQKVPVVDFKAKDWYVSKVDGKIHNIYNSVDRIEPKFKVGDIIINIHYKWDGKHRIREITDGKYIFDGGSYINIKEQDSWELANKVEPKFKVGDLIRLKDGDGLEWTIKEMHHDGYYTIVCEDRDDFIYLDDRWELVGKLVDKIEAKFHEGEWVVINGFTIPILITDVHNDLYDTIFANGEHRIYDTNVIDKDAHLWTIQDAKDGDVLASNRSIFIFSQEYIAGKPEAHCGIMNGLFIAKSEGCWTNEECYPATKEQRDILFAKMKEAGYEWDAEKKELKKISQRMVSAEAKEAMYDKPACVWSEEDENVLEDIEEAIINYWYGDTQDIILEWLESLKQRIGG